MKAGRAQHEVGRGGRRAISLIEATVSIALVGGLLTVSLNFIAAAATGQKNMGERGRADLLAVGLISEILNQAYMEPIDTPVFGRESGESGGSRAEYDDVDDYDGWKSSPPENPDGTEMSQLADFEREVSVAYVDPSDLKTTILTDAGVKQVTVTVRFQGKPLSQMVALRTAAEQTQPE